MRESFSHMLGLHRPPSMQDRIEISLHGWVGLKETHTQRQAGHRVNCQDSDCFFSRGKSPLFLPLSYLVAHNTRKGEKAKESFFVLVLCSLRVLRAVHSVWAFTHTRLCVFARRTPLKQSRAAGQNIVEERPDNRRGPSLKERARKFISVALLGE